MTITNNKGRAPTKSATQNDHGCDCNLRRSLNLLAHRLDRALESLPACHAADQISDIAGELRALPQKGGAQ